MKVLAALGIALPLVAAKVSYDGYKVFHIDSHDNYDAVQEALANVEHVSLSCESDHKTFDIAVAPGSVSDLEALGLDAKLINEDLGADIALESVPAAPFTASSKDEFGIAALPDISYFSAYHTFDEHGTYLTSLQAAFPNNSETFTIGTTVEGRALRGIHLWGKDGKGKHQAVIWHGNVHAREWITGVTVEYLAYKLVDGYQKAEAVSVKTLDSYDFYILPIVNPDGFVYTSSSDRLWRKNRQTRTSSSCVGTDVNRNWPYKWDTPGGSSTSPCAETYRGVAAGDTREMAALTNHTQSIANAVGIKSYIDWHSYSQLILLPYGYSCSASAPNLSKQMSLASSVATAIKAVNGLSFQYGPTCSTIYLTAGGSMDWVFDIAGAELAWGIELRPTSSASNGFVIAPSNIVPSGEETWAGMKALFNAW